MSLQQAIRAAMRARGVETKDLLARMAQRDRSTVYRLLSGDTRDTRLSTLLALCSALGISPNELLVQAGLWQSPPAPVRAEAPRAWRARRDG